MTTAHGKVDKCRMCQGNEEEVTLVQAEGAGRGTWLEPAMESSLGHTVPADPREADV